jgi:hypothetical protein
VRERRGSYNGFCCRLYPFICWIIIKEGPGNFSGGRSPHFMISELWVKIFYSEKLVPIIADFFCSHKHFLQLPKLHVVVLQGITRY